MTLHEILEFWKFYHILEACGINMRTDGETKNDQHVEPSFVIKSLQREKKERKNR